MVVGDAPHEDLSEGIGDVPSRQLSTRLEPQIRVVVHTEPGQGGEPRLQIAEVAGVNTALEDRLDLLLVLPAPLAELSCVFTGEGRELVQENPDMVRVAMDHVQELDSQHRQLLRRRSPRFCNAIRTEHHLVHHPVVDRRQERFFGSDVVVQGALAEVVRFTELCDARGVVTLSGENACGRVDDRLIARLPGRSPARIARRFLGRWHRYGG